MDGPGSRYAVPIHWMGLHPSQVQHLSKPTVFNGSSYPALPAAVFQEMTELDKKRLVDHFWDESLLLHFHHQERGRLIDELHDMMDEKSIGGNALARHGLLRRLCRSVAPAP